MRFASSILSVSIAVSGAASAAARSSLRAEQGEPVSRRTRSGTCVVRVAKLGEENVFECELDPSDARGEAGATRAIGASPEQLAGLEAMLAGGEIVPGETALDHGPGAEFDDVSIFLPPGASVVTSAGARRHLGLFGGGNRKGGGKGKSDSKSYIVTFSDNGRDDETSTCEDLARSMGGTVGYVYDQVLSGCSLSIPEGSVNALKNDPAVAMIEEDSLISVNAPPSWGLDRINQVSAQLDNRWQKVEASGVRVYIADTGIEGNHGEFNGRINPGNGCHRDFAWERNALNDGHGHGTHVASTACGNTYGVARNCDLCAVKVLNSRGQGYWSWFIAGLNFVASNCRGRCVLNASLGGPRSTQVNAAVRAARNRGVVVVVAAGNSYRDACNYSPSSEPHAITVGAIQRGDRRPSWSNWGSCVDVFAPGVSIKAAWQPSGTRTISGTSMASPHVAGIAAGHLRAGIPHSQVPARIAAASVARGFDSRTRGAGIATIFSSSQPTPRPTPRPRSPSPSCMSGETRVGVQSKVQFKSARDLHIGDVIEGLDENMDPATCSVEAVGHFGIGPVFGNYTKDHFILDDLNEVVRPNGRNGEKYSVDKYAVLTSCPVGIDESGVGFTAVDSDFLGDEAVSWSDYVLVHQSIVNIVREGGDYFFWPSTYISMTKVSEYTGRLYKTMLDCAKDPGACDLFEEAAVDLVDNALTKGAKQKVKAGFANLGKSNMTGSVAAVVSKGKSVRE